MIKLSYLFFILMNNKFIKNIDYPPCKNCVFYKPSGSFADFASPYGKCEMFGDKNIVNDEITYEYADYCRKDINKCGKEGKYFEEDVNLPYKILVHKVTSTSYITVPIMILFFNFFILNLINTKTD